jgi:hypothetical protein
MKNFAELVEDFVVPKLAINSCLVETSETLCIIFILQRLKGCKHSGIFQLSVQIAGVGRKKVFCSVLPTPL